MLAAPLTTSVWPNITASGSRTSTQFTFGRIISTVIFVTFLALHTAYLGNGERWETGGARDRTFYFTHPAHTWPLNLQILFFEGR